MIKMENINYDLLLKYNAIHEYVADRVKSDGLVKTVEKYKKVFQQKLDVIIEEYNLIDKESYQSIIPYQKYILLMNSRLSNIGPIYELVPEYNEDWLIEMMCDCHFAYICYILERQSLTEGHKNNYDDCIKILNR